MSGFFSLGGSTFAITKDQQEEENDPHNNNNQEQQDSIITPNSLYLFKNEEIYNKGFDLWQQYYQLHRHHHQQNPTQHYDHHHSSKRTSSSTSCGVEDLCLNNNNNSSNCDTNNNNNLYTSWKVMRAGSSGYGIGSGEHGGGSGSGSGSGGVNCQDCGNQAKKDCQHMRCRTCCKSRGFQCQTHVKSTWVPAAKRRERQQQLQSLTAQNQQHNMAAGSQQLSLMMRGGGGGGDGIDQNPKRLREDHHQLMVTSATTTGGGGVSALNLPVAHHHNTLGFEVGLFPAEVSSPAVFRCVRVSAMAEAEEQLAYQTAVNIGGHLFKGILYDHGPDGGSTSGGRAHHHHQQQHQQHNLITSGTMGMANAVTVAHPNVTGSIDPSIYPTPLNTFMAGTQFFPPPR